MTQAVLCHRARGLALAMILVTLMSLSAVAQDLPSGTVPPPWTAGPLDPNAPVPAIKHQSVLKAYQPWAEAAKVPWREANETVSRIGGWRTYLREAQRPEEMTRPIDPPVTPRDAR